MYNLETWKYRQSYKGTSGTKEFPIIKSQPHTLAQPWDLRAQKIFCNLSSCKKQYFEMQWKAKNLN